MSALPPKADIERHNWHIRFVPKAAKRTAAKKPLFDHLVGAAEQRDEIAASHSITSSARASNVCGTVRPSAWAVLRLIISKYFIGICTGSSDGFAPRRILST